MNIGNGKRDEWEFEYTASKLAEGAAAQKAFRLKGCGVESFHSDTILTGGTVSHTAVEHGITSRESFRDV